MPPTESKFRARTACLVCVPLIAYSANPVAAGDAAAGRAKAQQCQACHGLDGVGKMLDVPNIGGESDFYLGKQLRAFRSGERQHEQMSIVASGLSDEDIDDLAAYYASIEFTVKVPGL
jgi:cytochrome c553